MSQGTRMPLVRANALARSVIAELGRGCERIEIAGSIRRCKEDVGDIELVAIPKRPEGLFGPGEGQGLIDAIIHALVLEDRLIRAKNGPRCKQFWITKHEMKLDLFLCEPSTWGVIFAIRTGSADFSKRLVTHRSHGGMLPDALDIKDGRLWDRDRNLLLDTPEEQDLFRAIGMTWVQPRDRQ